MMLVFLLCLFLFSYTAEALAEEVSKQAVLQKYEKTIKLAEELNVYEEDVHYVVPKIRIAYEALLENDFERADRVLNEALADLQLLEKLRPTRIQRALRLEWLEIYREIFQKFAVLALLAYLFARFPYFRKSIRTNRFTVMGRIYLSFLVAFGSILVSFIDLSRYGESALAFLNIQVVLLTVGGLIGGLGVGIFSSILVALFRLALASDFTLFLIIVLGAGIVGGVFSRWIQNYEAPAKMSLLAGSIVGMYHGCVIYLPLMNVMPWNYLLLSIGFLMLLEGGAVFVMMAVISGILREQGRQELERDLLNTKLRFLQAQISPHFLYNALNTISAVCGRENATQTKNLVLRLAEFLRGTLKKAEDLVPLREEIAHIDSYLDIEKARFGERLVIEKQFDIREELWNLKVPFLILQPLVENAIKHGISKKASGGTVKLVLSESKGCLQAKITDNGVGMDQAKIQDVLTGRAESGEVGIGVQNIQQRLIRLFGPSHRLNFESSVGQGTTVTVEIPVETHSKREDPSTS